MNQVPDSIRSISRERVSSGRCPENHSPKLWDYDKQMVASKCSLRLMQMGGLPFPKGAPKVIAHIILECLPIPQIQLGFFVGGGGGSEVEG